MIHVCFGLSDKDGCYSKFTGTAILSMFENCSTPPPCVTVHILHDNTLTQENRDKFIYIAECYRQIMEFHNFEEICADEIARLRELFKDYSGLERFTLGSFASVLTPLIFPEKMEKVIYLDSDIIVNLDINELWQIDLVDKPLAAVPEMLNNIFICDINLCRNKIVNFGDYFNAGILVMNLKRLRENESENLANGIYFLSRNPKYRYFDQEVLNYCFSKNYLRLPGRFNVFTRFHFELADLVTSNRILHYTSKDLSTNINNNPFHYLWFSYFEKTPWFTKDVIAQLDEEIKKIVYMQNVIFTYDVFKELSSIFGKSRAFVTTAQNLDNVKNFFAVRDDEEIILLVNKASFRELLKSMTESRGKKIYFILFSGYHQLRSYLMNAGFVEGRDFINAALFLPEEKEKNLNTYELVRSM